MTRRPSSRSLCASARLTETKLKDTAKAIETYDGVLVSEPAHRGALGALARLHEAKGNDEGASSALSRLLDQSSGAEGVAIALRLAAAYGRQKNDEGSRSALERALSFDDKSTEVREQLRKLYERTVRVGSPRGFRGG